LFLPAKKEIHYFDTNWFQPISWYGELFSGAGDRLAGEITPTYCTLQPRRIRSIRGLIPDVRLVILLRDPVERDWSHMRMALLRDTGRSPEQVPVSEYLTFAQEDERMKRGDYGVVLTRWLSIFEPSKLLIGFYEDLATRPRQLLGAVLDHIGVPRPSSWESFPLQQKFWEGIQAPMPVAVRDLLVDRHLRSTQLLQSLIGNDQLHRWHSNWGHAQGL
jgi:hypothetical protein